MVCRWYGFGLEMVLKACTAHAASRAGGRAGRVGYPDTSSMQSMMHSSGLIGPISARIILSLRRRIANPLITLGLALSEYLFRD